MDPLLQQTLENFAKQGNSYGKSVARCALAGPRAWTSRSPTRARSPSQYVWFVGDFASFDERAQVASRSVARILHDAGVSFGLLYEGERNAGNDVRRVGEEGLFEMLAEQNMGVAGRGEFEAIFTTDPHSLNTLRNEYPQFGLDKPVYHYTELLADLCRAAYVSLSDPADRDARHLPRPLLPGPLQPDHRGAAKADRGHRRRTGRDAAPRNQHVLLRRRRRPDLDNHGGIAGAGGFASATGFLRNTEAARGRGGDPGQNQPQRVGKHSLQPFHQRLEWKRRPDQESLRARSQSLRFYQFRLGRSRFSQSLRACGGHGNRRLGGLSVVRERDRGAQADIGPDQPCRHYSNRAQPGYGRAHGPDRPRCGHPAQCACRRRSA